MARMTKLEQFQATQAAFIKMQVEKAKKNIITEEVKDVYTAQAMCDFVSHHKMGAGLYIFTVGGVEVARTVKIWWYSDTSTTVLGSGATP